LDEDAHLVTKACMLFLVMALNVLTKQVNLMWATTYIRGDVIQNGQAL